MVRCMSRLGPKAAMAVASLDVRFGGQSRRDVLVLSFPASDSRAASAQPRMMFGFKGNKVRCDQSDLPRRLLFVCLRWQSGKHLLVLSPSAFNPGCVKTPQCRAARSTRARIERIAKAVADQVEGKNSKKNCKPRPNCHPGRIDEETLGGIEHAAQRRRWRLLAKSQKRQRRFGGGGGWKR